ncbi:hypothetical protein EW146_g5069 [Bondarzewia mesenterica]|uniref:Uncharacterized protein n=1 Tax=Bondarzewia mesenterica TaxID=1095465 RepID=A0A4S4LUP5_9AGAM|nr:hypothetical protein EW146_g5069 [Bondarzewia mesenterica]
MTTRTNPNSPPSPGVLTFSNPFVYQDVLHSTPTSHTLYRLASPTSPPPPPPRLPVLSLPPTTPRSSLSPRYSTGPISPLLNIGLRYSSVAASASIIGTPAPPYRSTMSTPVSGAHHCWCAQPDAPYHNPAQHSQLGMPDAMQFEVNTTSPFGFGHMIHSMYRDGPSDVVRPLSDDPPSFSSVTGRGRDARVRPLFSSSSLSQFSFAAQEMEYGADRPTVTQERPAPLSSTSPAPNTQTLPTIVDDRFAQMANLDAYPGYPSHRLSPIISEDIPVETPERTGTYIEGNSYVRQASPTLNPPKKVRVRTPSPHTKGESFVAPPPSWWHRFANKVSKNPTGHVYNGDASSGDDSRFDRRHSTSVHSDQLDFTPPIPESRVFPTLSSAKDMVPEYMYPAELSRRYSSDSIEDLYANDPPEPIGATSPLPHPQTEPLSSSASHATPKRQPSKLLPALPTQTEVDFPETMSPSGTAVQSVRIRGISRSGTITPLSAGPSSRHFTTTSPPHQYQESMRVELDQIRSPVENPQARRLRRKPIVNFDSLQFSRPQDLAHLSMDNVATLDTPSSSAEQTGPVAGKWWASQLDTGVSVGLRIHLPGAILDLPEYSYVDLPASPQGSSGDVSDNISILTVRPHEPGTPSTRLSARLNDQYDSQASSTGYARSLLEDDYSIGLDPSVILSESTLSSVTTWSPNVSPDGDEGPAHSHTDVSTENRSTQAEGRSYILPTERQVNAKASSRSMRETRLKLENLRDEINTCLRAVARVRLRLYSAERKQGSQQRGGDVCTDLRGSLNAVTSVLDQIRQGISAAGEPSNTESTWLQRRQGLFISLQHTCSRISSIEKKIARHDLSLRLQDIYGKLELFERKVFDLYKRLALSHHIVQECRWRAELRAFHAEIRRSRDNARGRSRFERRLSDTDREMLRELGANIRRERQLIAILCSPESPLTAPGLKTKLDEVQRKT